MFAFAESILRRAGVPLPLFGLDPSLSVRAQNARLFLKNAPAFVTQWLKRNPLPPASAMFLVQGNYDAGYYVSNGRAAFDTVWETLQKSWVDVYQMHRVLDFGCGCGRVLRHWKPYSASFDLHGTDYNAELVYWAQSTCRHATVRQNALAPPFAYADNHFDLIYALSVFTHLTVDLQDAWMAECRRILRPGGMLLFTTHGDYSVPFMPEAHVSDYKGGKVVVIDADHAGENVCAAFHPFVYVQTVLLRDFKLLQFYPRSGRGVPWQDVYLAQKPLSPAAKS